MLFGSTHLTLDSKGRIFLSAKFKEQMKSPSGKVYVMRGYDGAMAIYNEEAFQKRIDELTNFSFRNGKARNVIRMDLSSVADLDIDDQGRILFPKKLLAEYKILSRRIVLNGVMDHIEIWDEDAWEEYRSNANKSYESDSESLEEKL